MTKSTTPSQSDLLQAAVLLHQKGQLAEANRMYRQILRTVPHHFEALHFSGVIAKQTGDPERAILLISTALESVGTGINVHHASALCNLGACYQELQQPEQAMQCYQRAIELKPDYAIAHNNLGNAFKHLERYQEALNAYRQAINLTPDNAEAFYNAGLVLHLTGEFDTALNHFDRALSFRPHHAQTWFARGLSLQQSARFEIAIDSYNRAIDLKPDYAEAFFNLGILHNRVMQYERAVASFALAIQYRPDYAKAYFYSGNAYRQLLQHEAAIAAYQRAGELGVDADSVRFALATLGIGETPMAPPANYIRELFDQYADHFDEHLTKVLRYAIPEQIAQAVSPYLLHAQLDSLDLGCGTGLCAGWLRSCSRELTGVDLSQNMLNQAARLNLYDHLICAEITAFLFAEERQTDLIIAADVLVYLGDLKPVVQGVERVLRPGGLFCFSVEDSRYLNLAGDFILQTSNRYAHSQSYIETLAQQCGFRILSLSQQTGREENQISSAALIVLLQKVS